MAGPLLSREKGKKNKGCRCRFLVALKRILSRRREKMQFALPPSLKVLVAEMLLTKEMSWYDARIEELGVRLFAG